MSAPLECLGRLRVDRSQGEPAPHQPCLLLAIICEIQAGHIASPQVRLDTRLLARYHDLFEIVSGERHRARPWMPLWALRNREGPSGTLWRPHYAKHLRGVVESLGQPKSLSQLEARFTEATLDPQLFAALQAPASAREACALLSQRYLATNHSAYQRLQAYLELTLVSGDYERHPEKLAAAIHEPEPREARSKAFRELVLEAYDYRCAASRLRYITPDYRYLVEAAHLIPFADSRTTGRPTASP